MSCQAIAALLLSLVSLVSLASPLVCSAAAADQRPHIVYINADDLGVRDVGSVEAAFRTPHIDRLAEQGVVFANAYAPAANCAPSRACVLSGQWTPRHGVYTVRNSDRGRAATRRLVPTPNRIFLSPETVTLAEHLRGAGYRTIHLGKYHIGRDPLADGFDVNVGGDESGSPAGGYDSPWETSAMAAWDGTVDHPTHRADVFAREAAAFLREHAAADRPLFVHFAPYLVHTPLTLVPEHADGYAEAGIDPRYGSMVTKLDEAVGAVLAALDESGLAESTLVVFSSDNGGVAAIHSQRPFRGGKGSYYDGGIREPLIVRWPARVAGGRTLDEVVGTLDLFPTLLDAAGIALPTGESAPDGASLLPLLTGEGTWRPRPLFWHFPVYLQAYAGAKDDARDPLFRTRPGSAMRDGRWKLHEYFEDGAIELYDLAADPGERTDLAAAMPDRAAALHRQLIAWRERTGAPVPTEPNPKFDAAAERRQIERASGGQPGASSSRRRATSSRR